MSRFPVSWVVSCALALVLAAPAGAGTLFVIDGRGWGHGVGMSQYGAQGYALDGWRYPRILAHYYRGTELAVLPGRDGARAADGRAARASASARRSPSGSSTRAARSAR